MLLFTSIYTCCYDKESATKWSSVELITDTLTEVGAADGAGGIVIHFNRT